MAILLRYLIASFILWNRLSQRWYVSANCKKTDLSFNISCIYRNITIYRKQGTNSPFGHLWLSWWRQSLKGNKGRFQKLLTGFPHPLYPLRGKSFWGTSSDGFHICMVWLTMWSPTSYNGWSIWTWESPNRKSYGYICCGPTCLKHFPSPSLIDLESLSLSNHLFPYSAFWRVVYSHGQPSLWFAACSW